MKTNDTVRDMPSIVDCISELFEEFECMKKGPNGIWAIAHLLGYEIKNGHEIYIGAVLSPTEKKIQALGLTNFDLKSYNFKWYKNHQAVNSLQTSEFIVHLQHWAREMTEDRKNETELPLAFVNI